MTTSIGQYKNYCQNCEEWADSETCRDCGEYTETYCGTCKEALDNCDCELEEVAQ